MEEAKNIFLILDELREKAKQVDNDGLKAVETLITEANRIFIGGAGRSGFCARGFSNRLMHLGLPAGRCPAARWPTPGRQSGIRLPQGGNPVPFRGAPSLIWSIAINLVYNNRPNLSTPCKKCLPCAHTDGIISALMNIMHKGAPPLRQGTVQ